MTTTAKFRMVMDPEMGTYKRCMRIVIGERTYHVSVVGLGKPVICFHGFSESGYTWDTIKLQGYSMYRIDLLGHGSTDKPMDREPYEIPSMLEELHTVVQLVAGSSYRLMGYSMGARLALLYTLAYKDEVEQLILESGSVGIALEEERHNRLVSDDELAQKIESHDVQWFGETWSKVPIFHSQQTLAKQVQEKIFARRIHNAPQVLANTLRGSGQGSMPYVGQNLDEVKCPLLYISGALDTKYDSIRREVFHNRPNCTTVSVLGAGHNVHLEKPEQFEQVVEEFLNLI